MPKLTDTNNYLSQRLDQLSDLSDYVRENMNPANPDDMLEYKRLSMHSGHVRELMKHEFQIEHNLQKKVLNSFN